MQVSGQKALLETRVGLVAQVTPLMVALSLMHLPLMVVVQPEK